MTAPTTRPEPTDEHSDDAGRALIEVLILGVLLLIPTVYLLSAVLRVQSATFAVTQAARDAGRLIDTAPDLDSGVQRATEAARIALADQRLPGDAVTVRFVAPGAGCDSRGDLPHPGRRRDLRHLREHPADPARRALDVDRQATPSPASTPCTSASTGRTDDRPTSATRTTTPARSPHSSSA